MSDIPTPPGSELALSYGCQCPVIDNYHGRGVVLDGSGEPTFVVNETCPLHGGEGPVDVKETTV